jgi:hypothetical protein
MLPDMAPTTVRALDRLRAIIAELDWSAFSPDMKVTISAGVTTLKPEETGDYTRARRQRFMRGNTQRMPAPDPAHFSSGGGEPSPAFAPDRVKCFSSLSPPRIAWMNCNTLVHGTVARRVDPAPGHRSLHQRR